MKRRYPIFLLGGDQSTSQERGSQQWPATGIKGAQHRFLSPVENEKADANTLVL